MWSRTGARVFAIWLPLVCGNNVMLWAGQEQTARFAISPNPALMDERVTVRVEGLPANREITIRARSKDQADCWWTSSATYRARPEDGAIDLTAQAPLSGSYAGVDGMGPFWSMRPDGSKAATAEFFSVVDWFGPLVTELEAVVDSRVVGTAKIVRRFARAGVQAEPFRRDGVVANLYRPGDGGRHRGILLLGGSEGGFPTPEGPMLASRGYIVLALAYFGAPGLPASMQRIPIEYFGRAIQALRALPDVDGDGVAVIGGSRGAEAALMLGAMYPEVRGVVATSSSHVRWEGSTAGMRPGGPAWTLGGKPLPYVPFHIGAGFAARFVWSKVSGTPVSLEPMFVDSLSRVRSDEAQIAVERTRGPILLASGARDRKWPSSWMSARAMERLKQKGHAYSDDHVCFQGAGHWIPVAYLPAGGLWGRIAAEIGGTPEGTADAQARWWPRLLAFLEAIPRSAKTR